MSNKSKSTELNPKYSSKFSGGPTAASGSAAPAVGASPAAASRATNGASASSTSLVLTLLEVASSETKPSSTGAALSAVATLAT